MVKSLVSKNGANIYIFFLNLFPSILLHFQDRAAKRNGTSDFKFSTRAKWHWHISSGCSQRADRNFSDLRVREENERHGLVCQNSWLHVVKTFLFRRPWPVLIKYGYTYTIPSVCHGLLYGASLLSKQWVGAVPLWEVAMAVGIISSPFALMG